MTLSPRILDFSEVYAESEDLVGKKAHELGTLHRIGIPLPNGFVITFEFFKDFLSFTGINREINSILSSTHPALRDSVGKLLEPVQEKIIRQHFPQELSMLLHKFYRDTFGVLNEKTLTVSSSTLNRKTVSFPRVCGDANLILTIKSIWSDSLRDPVAIVVQEKISSGIRGKIVTDNPVIDKKLTETQVSKLKDCCMIMRKHFYFPMEVEYVVSKNKFYVVNVNPFTGIVNEIAKSIVQRKKNKVLIRGISINPGIVTGPVKILNRKDVQIKAGEVILLPELNSSTWNRLKIAKAIITDSVFKRPLDKTLFREKFKIPTIIGVKNATKIFKNGNVITVNGVSGEIYSGGLVY